jgi:hypothetical protein
MKWQFGFVRIIRLSCYAETMHILHKDINASFVLETTNVSQTPKLFVALFTKHHIMHIVLVDPTLSSHHILP